MAQQQITCPYCGLAFPADDTHAMVTCPACTGEFALPVQVRARPRPDDLVYDPVAVLVEDAYVLLNTKIESSFFDANVKMAEVLFREALQRDSRNATAWKGLFDCALWEVCKTFLNRKRLKGTDYWLDTSRFQSAEWYRVDSYFCRVVVQQGRATAYIVDEILQPGRKAKKYLDSAIQYAGQELREEYTQVHQEFFEIPLAEMAAAGYEAIQAMRDGEGGDKRLRKGPPGISGTPFLPGKGKGKGKP